MIKAALDATFLTAAVAGTLQIYGSTAAWAAL